MSRHHHLSWRIEIGCRDHTLLRSSLAEFDHLLIVESENGRHRALPFGHGGLHQRAPMLEQHGGFLEVHGAAAHQRAVLPHAMARQY